MEIEGITQSSYNSNRAKTPRALCDKSTENGKFGKSNTRPIVQEGAAGKPRKGKHTALSRRGGLRDTTREYGHALAPIQRMMCLPSKDDMLPCRSDSVRNKEIVCRRFC